MKTPLRSKGGSNCSQKRRGVFYYADARNIEIMFFIFPQMSK